MRLRRKLGDDAADPKYIITEPRVGYRVAARERDSQQSGAEYALFRIENRRPLCNWETDPKEKPPPCRQGLGSFLVRVKSKRRTITPRPRT